MASLFKSLLKVAASPPKAKKARFPKVSNYIPNERSTDGTWCTASDGEGIIRQYYHDIHGSRKAEEAAVKAFFDILEITRIKLDEVSVEFKNDLDETISYVEEESQNAANDEERRDATELGELDIQESRKALSRVEKWVSKNLQALEKDCRKPLRAVLSTVKTSETEGFYLTADRVEYERDYKYPEPPDSFY
jgi:hypothetical protein